MCQVVRNSRIRISLSPYLSYTSNRAAKTSAIATGTSVRTDCVLVNLQSRQLYSSRCVSSWQITREKIDGKRRTNCRTVLAASWASNLSHSIHDQAAGLVWHHTEIVAFAWMHKGLEHGSYSIVLQGGVRLQMNQVIVMSGSIEIVSSRGKP